MKATNTHCPAAATKNQNTAAAFNTPSANRMPNEPPALAASNAIVMAHPPARS
jgi:hypothetical protein